MLDALLSALRVLIYFIFMWPHCTDEETEA